MEDMIKSVIELTLREVREQGWDLIDAIDYKAVEMVYKKIKNEI